MFQTEMFQKNLEALTKRCEEVSVPLLRLDRLLADYVRTHEVDFLPYFSVPAEQVEIWGRGFKQRIQKDGGFFIYGFMDGQCVRKLLALSDESNTFCVYEPELERFLLLMSTVDLTDLLGDRRVCLVLREINDRAQFQEYVIRAVNYRNYRLLSFLALPGYREDSEPCRQFYGYVQYAIDKVEMNKAVQIEHARVCRENLFANIPTIFGQHSVAQFACILRETDISEIPAFLVAAGPSLDKNVQELKKAQGHGMILTVDTALKAVLRAGVRPDLTICADPNKEAVLFDHEDFKSIPAVFDCFVPPELLKRHRAEEFFFDDDLFLSELLLKYKKTPYGKLSTGGSVANCAFSLLRKMGFRTVILVGQDLAYTGGRGHNKDAYDDEEKNRNDTLGKNGEILCEVEGIDGKPVMTEARMKSYREWFENQIKFYPEVTVLNATEGGALIHGCEHVKLRDAIDTYCAGKTFDFDAILKKIPPLLNETEQKAILQEFVSLPETLNGLSRTLEEGRAAYLRMAKLAKQNKAVPPELMDTVKAVNRIHQENLWMRLVVKYTQKEEYGTIDALYGDKAKNLNLVQIAENAVKLLEAYMDGIKALQQDIHLVTDQLEPAVCSKTE